MPDIQPVVFHSRAGFVPFPDSFFTHTVPRMQELAELKVVLYAAYLILRKRDPSTQGSESSVTYKQLKAEACRLSPELGEETLLQALNSAVEHGVLSRSTLNIDEAPEDVYSLTGDSLQPTTINIFALYEQNIGMITPMIAEELREAEKSYPPQWIEEALKEAVALNKRSWRYIARILERWASEGKDSGEYRRHTKTYGPDKYVKGKYGHFVKR